MAQSTFNYAQFIWSAADILRGTFKQHEYGDVILPFTVLRRLDAVLAPTKQAVLDVTEGFDPATPPSIAMLRNRAGHDYNFFNLSRHSLSTIQGDVHNIAENLKHYVSSFSENVRDIFDQYKFEETVDALERHNLLLQILQHFSKADLHPDSVSNEQMGHIFEELIRRFAEVSNETAGEHFTPREVIELMVTLLLDRDPALLTPGIVRSVYDPTAGTGGMLSVADDKIRHFQPNADVSLFGQELNPSSFAICKADMVVKGQPIENIVLGNTLTDPAFENQRFHYALSNPPFGVDWKQYKTQIDNEHRVLGFAGRFGAGLPRVSDGSLLFLQHLLSTLKDPSSDQNAFAGRGAIVLNGSPLFTGGAGSGESNIRKWVLDNDYLDAIIGLPTDMFYNTGISTYIWVLAKEKEPRRRGKVQLIDATEMFEKMRKSIGSKRKQLSEANIAEIVRLYSTFEDSKHSKIFDREEFYFRTITVERPLKLTYALSVERIERAMASKNMEKIFKKLSADVKPSLNAALCDGVSLQEFDRAEFIERLKSVLSSNDVRFTNAQLDILANELAERSETGHVLTKKNGEVEPDSNLRDTENVPWNQDVHEYLDAEVLPFVPDAWIDESKTKEGVEIPFTRHFYEYVPPRSLEEIDRDLDEVLGRIRERLEQVKR